MISLPSTYWFSLAASLLVVGAIVALFAYLDYRYGKPSPGARRPRRSVPPPQAGLPERPVSPAPTLEDRRGN